MATPEIIDLTIPVTDLPTLSDTSCPTTQEAERSSSAHISEMNATVDSTLNPNLKNASEQVCIASSSTFKENPTATATTGAGDDSAMKVDSEVVQISKTAPPRRKRKKSRKSSVVQSGEEDKKEDASAREKEKKSSGNGDERTGDKRKREADDDGDDSNSGDGQMEEGEVEDSKMDIQFAVQSQPSTSSTQQEPEPDKTKSSRSEPSSPKPKSKPKSKSEAKTKRQSSSQSQTSPPPASAPPLVSAPAPAPAVAEPESASELFFIDVTPTAVPSVLVDDRPAVAIEVDAEATNTKLLVPAHVTVLGSTPVEIIEKPTVEEGEEGEEDEDYIDYLDFDDARGITRYFQEAPDPTATLSRTVCKNCGAEGEHKTSACPVQICLTCGARNEHSTRSCPISKVCYTCGMKGHINSTCPNRRTGRYMMSTKDQECDRCFSSFHKTNECPTWWRIYEYFSTEGQKETLARRLSKKGLLLGEGGEAYIADDEWCYNCGSAGHWGDDCDDARMPPNDYSAFSSINVMKSPFWDPTEEKQNKSKSANIPKRHIDDYNTQWAADAPERVGKKARDKARLAMQKRVEKVDDDDDDWFGNRSRGGGNGQGDKNSAVSAALPKGAPTEPKKMRFGFSLDTKSKAEHGSLLARLEVPSGNDYPRSEKRDEKKSDRNSRNGGGGMSDRKKERDRHSDRDKSRYRDRRDDWRDSGRNTGREETRNGSRYRGGYSR